MAKEKGIWQLFKGNDLAWSEILNDFPESSYLNDSSWGEHFTHMGWQSCRWEFLKGEQKRAYLQSFFKSYPGGIGVLWIPDGVVGGYKNIANLQRDICNSLNLRFCYIRFRSFQTYDIDDHIQLLISGWSKPSKSFRQSMTMILDISDSIENIQARLSQNWRRTLKKSLNNDLDIIEVKDPKTIADLYKELMKTKKLRARDIYSEDVIKSIMKAFKDKIIILGAQEVEGKLVAIRGAVYRNGLATDIFAASNSSGRALSATHGLLLALIEQCKEKGCVSYDLNGIDPESGKGVYLFKQGTGAVPKASLGEFEWTNSLIMGKAISFLSKFR